MTNTNDVTGCIYTAYKEMIINTICFLLLGATFVDQLATFVDQLATFVDQLATFVDRLFWKAAP